MLVWLLIFTLLILAVVLAFSGIWRRARNTGHIDDGQDQAMYHARLSEIDTDYELGRIDAEARDAAKAEQARILLRLSRAGSADATTSPSQTFAVIVAAMVFVPALSLAIYQMKGSPDVGYFTAQQAGQDEQSGQPTLQELMASAEAQLAKNPDDLRGWRAVAPVYMRTGRFDKAAIAFRNMIRLGENSLDTRRALAETLVVLNNNQVGDESLELFKGILKELPKDIGARFFIAEGALQRGNRQEARRIWENLRSEAKGQEPWLQTVVARLQELDGIEPKPGFSAEQLEQIEGMVSGLAERLEDDPDDKTGWERLVRSYMVLGNREKAEAAYMKALEHFPQDRELAKVLEAMLENTTDKGTDR